MIVQGPTVRKVRRYRLYIDESGDHTYVSIEEAEKRYLGLTGIFVEQEYYRSKFQPTVEALKQKHFPHSPDDPVILHRRDIIDCHGAFWRLRNKQSRTAFNQDLLKFFATVDFKIITIVIDKKAHIERYGEAAFHPYHYCLFAILERYCGFLNFYNAQGDVMVESRQKKEDILLKEAYREVYQRGTQWRRQTFFSKVLTSKDLKAKQKEANIAGIQLADLLAHPSKQEILVQEKRIADPGDVFSAQIRVAIAGKYNRQIYQGRITGYGKIFLK